MKEAVGKLIPADMDVEHLRIIRSNVSRFLMLAASKYALKPGCCLDIAPQVHEGARTYFPDFITVETLDIDPNSRCTYIADICQHNSHIAACSFDYVVCTEVLEHTLRPWDAVQEIARLMKAAGLLFVSVPFNFRIHGPLPDCWRFTEHGVRALFSSHFEIMELDAIETPGRPLMPIHYTVVARKKVSND